MNKIDIENIKEIIRYREHKPKWKKGGELDWEQITSKTTEELKALVETEENNHKLQAAKRAKDLVDLIFSKYAEEDDNMIALGAVGYSDESRCTWRCENPLISVNWKRKEGSRWNSLAFPIGRGWDLESYPNPGKEEDNQKYIEYSNLVDELEAELYDSGIDDIESYWNDQNYAINDCWLGFHAVTKDYKVVTFTIREDGLLCNNSIRDTLLQL